MCCTELVTRVQTNYTKRLVDMLNRVMQDSLLQDNVTGMVVPQALAPESGVTASHAPMLSCAAHVTSVRFSKKSTQTCAARLQVHLLNKLGPLPCLFGSHVSHAAAGELAGNLRKGSGSPSPDFPAAAALAAHLKAGVPQLQHGGLLGLFAKHNAQVSFPRALATQNGS